MRVTLLVGISTAFVLTACGGDTLFGDTESSGSGASTSAGGNGGSGANGGNGAGTSSVGGTGGMASTSSSGGDGGTGGGVDPCPSGPDEDFDMDGYSKAQGDCDDCAMLVNPNAVEIGGDAVDDDCDGNLDNVPGICDGNIGLDNQVPSAVLFAIELCKPSTGPDDWGVASAAWVMPDGAPAPTGNDAANFHLGHGVMANFGPNVPPKRGQSLLVLSNGTARRPTDPGYQEVTNGGMGYQGTMPAGFPKAGSGCMNPGTGNTAFDPTAIEVVVRVPSNAFGFSFNFDFYAADYPDFVCSGFNDAFSAQVSPTPMGLPDGNVTFHNMADPFSINGAPFDVCGCMGGPPCMAGGQSYACSQGTSRLMGNGFGEDESENRGATGWQLTTVPANPGDELTVRWAVWDAADGIFTASTLVDNFAWVTDPVNATATVPDP